METILPTVPTHTHDMHSVIAPFALRPMKIIEQANRLMQRAEVLFKQHENIMKPKDREVAEHKMRK